jgi:putative membrane protein insertion efficiency factor
MTRVLTTPVSTPAVEQVGVADGQLPLPLPAPGVAARILISLVRIYQAARVGRPSPCRYVPSCSSYAVEALQRHGSLKGSWLAVRRLCRCHPWGGHGADPVPD